MARYVLLCLILIYFQNILKALISIDTDLNLILDNSSKKYFQHYVTCGLEFLVSQKYEQF